MERNYTITLPYEFWKSTKIPPEEHGIACLRMGDWFRKNEPEGLVLLTMGARKGEEPTTYLNGPSFSNKREAVPMPADVAELLDRARQHVLGEWIVFPTISDELIAEYMQGLRVIVNGHYLAPHDYRGHAFTWLTPTDEKAEGLEVYDTITTMHKYGAPSLFKPSVAEVLAQTPKHCLENACAFEIRDQDHVGFTKCSEYHVATTTFYQRKRAS